MLTGQSGTLRREAAESHYYPARETDAAMIGVRGAGRMQHEKFLVYRGVGTFYLPLRARLGGEEVLVSTRVRSTARTRPTATRSGESVRSRARR